MRRDLLLALLLLGLAALLTMFRAPTPARVPTALPAWAPPAFRPPRLGGLAPTFVPGRDLGCPTSDYTHVVRDHR